MLTVKQSQAIRATVLVLVAFGLTTFAVTAFAVTLDQIKGRGYARVAIAVEAPYACMGLDGTVNGIGPDVAEAVLMKLGVEDH